MNARLTELYRACRPEGALKSQDQFGSANVLLGAEVDKFAASIIEECARLVDTLDQAYGAPSTGGEFIRKQFGIIE